MPTSQWVFLGILLLSQGFYIFKQAKKYGLNYWLWGLIGLLNIPTSLIIFLFYLAYKKGYNMTEIVQKSMLAGLWGAGIFSVVFLVLKNQYSLGIQFWPLIIVGFLTTTAGYLLGKQ